MPNKYHKYRYIKKYTTLDEITTGLSDAVSFYHNQRTATDKRKYKALCELQSIANNSQDVLDFIARINQRLGDFDEDNYTTVEFCIYKWCLTNVEGA